VPTEPVSNVCHQDLLPVSRFDTGKAQPDTTDLPEEFDYRLVSFRQRVPSVAIYTLATLATQGLSHQALANPTSGFANQPQIKEGGDFVLPQMTEELASQKAKFERTGSTLAQRVAGAIASPESIVVQEFAPEAVRGSEPPITPPDRDAQKVVVPTVLSPVSQATSIGIAPPETEVTLGQKSAQKEDTIPVRESVASQRVSATMLADVQSHSAADLQEVSPLEPTATNLENSYTPASQETVSPQQNPAVVPQDVPRATEPCLEVEALQSQLRALEEPKDVGEFQASPALSIVIPTGFGIDNNTGFISATYQERTRYSNVDDGAIGFGIGLGDARKSVGVEVSYAIASFGSNRDFGSGGFNIKVHRQLPNDFAVAVGWNGFLNLGDRNDFEHSLYGVVTKVFRTRDDITLPFSRVAITVGVGNGQFRTEEAVDNDTHNINVFGNIAVRVAQPVSLIAEWSGQDLGVGLSIAPFKNIPLVITPAVRDITGAGDGTRFVLGTGLAFKF